MEITEVRIKLMEDSDDRLQAFCSITFDNAFVVRDLKIIEGVNGPFVAMPSRKLTAHCPQCGYKNHLRAHYCNQCGGRLREERPMRDADGRVKLYADIAHPINAQCRESIQKRVIAEFQVELDRAQEPGYVSRYDDDYGWEYDDDTVEVVGEPRRASTTGAASSTSNSAAPPVPAPVATTPAAWQSAPPGNAAAVDAAARTSAAAGGSAAGETKGGERRLEKKIVSQPAAQEPRPPHAAPHSPATHSPAPHSSAPGRNRKGPFGAGVFD